MIGIARADDTTVVNIGTPEAPDYLEVPDIKLGAVEWSAQRIPGGAIIVFSDNGRTVATLWHGPHDIGGLSHYIIDAPKAILQRLRNQLGAGNVAPLVRALQASASLRSWFRDSDFPLIRNSLNQPIGVRAKIVICGNSPDDLDGDDPELAQVMSDLETP